MIETEKRAAATKFYNDWRGIGDEKSDSQRFWIEFLGNVLGIGDITQKAKKILHLSIQPENYF